MDAGCQINDEKLASFAAKYPSSENCSIFPHRGGLTAAAGKMHPGNTTDFRNCSTELRENGILVCVAHRILQQLLGRKGNMSL